MFDVLRVYFSSQRQGLSEDERLHLASAMVPEGPAQRRQETLLVIHWYSFFCHVMMVMVMVMIMMMMMVMMMMMTMTTTTVTTTTMTMTTMMTTTMAAMPFVRIDEQ